MLIDFHTHAFPDTLAPRAMAGLLKHWVDQPIGPQTDGTLSGLIADMDRCGVDISVVAPIATKPSQTPTLCSWAKDISGERVVAFSSINPHSDDYKADIDIVVSHEIKGIKLHAEYQDFIVDSPKMLKIYDYAFEKGLIILQHSGMDVAFKAPFKSTPKMFADVSKQLGGGVMIAAHLGGIGMWDEVLDMLCGCNVYIDSSQGCDYYSKNQFTDIVAAHGADKILFGSDSPWGSPKREYDAIKKSGLSDEQEKLIFSENAKRLLRLDL